MRATVTTFEPLLQSVDRLITTLGDAGIPVKPTSRLSEYRNELAKAIPSKTPPSGDQMKRWHRLLIEVSDLRLIAEELSKPPAVPGWENKMREVLAGSFFSSRQSRNPRPRNTQFELVLAASLRAAGYDVALDEPDVVVRTTMGSVGVAAKRPSSERNLNHTIRDAGRQIRRFDGLGLIACDATILVNPDDAQLTTQDFAAVEAGVAAHAIDVAKRLAAVAATILGTKCVFGVMCRVCLPTWEPSVPRMSYIERWPVVALVGESDPRHKWCLRLVGRLGAAT